MNKAFLFLAFIASPLMAQDIDPARMLSGLRACYDAADTIEGKNACLWQMSNRCMDETQGGYSTLGQAQCMAAESDAWDALLNEEYRFAMDSARSLDETDADTPEFAVRADTLREAQRAWIPYRDANCTAAYAKWGMGSMRQIEGVSCLMRMTAQRTVELWALYETMR